MSLKWTLALKTGIEWQDAEHRELVDRINALITAAVEGRGKEEIGSIIGFLEGYAVKHFGNEEAAMSEYNYPGTAAHKAEHAVFNHELEKIRQEFEMNGASSLLVIQIQKKIGEWFLNHIEKTDIGLGAFLSKLR